MKRFLSVINQKLNNQLPNLIISNGMIESLKWLALVAMTSDHINYIFFKRHVPLMTDFGRIAMPIFGFVVAYNLARPAIQEKIYFRTMARMAFFGLLATPIYKYAFGLPNWIPLNILFTLLLATGIIYLIEKGGFYREMIAIALFFMVGALVEYPWVGLGYCLAAWYYCKKPSLWRLMVWMCSTALLYLANLNFWAFAAIPIIFCATQFDFKVPRLRLAFYIYYPLHLAFLFGIKMLITK